MRYARGLLKKGRMKKRINESMNAAHDVNVKSV